jgi:hypothetical protein
MKIIKKEQLETVRLPGREIHKAVGADAFSLSGKMTMGFARYSAASGCIEPHQHAEEICFVLAVERGSLRYGPARNNLDRAVILEPGMVLHIPELEWHVFEYEPGGYLEILYFYGQVENIRPEDLNSAG